MSSAEECVPCSPGRVTELITRRAGGTGTAGAGNTSRSGRGAGDLEKPQPRAMGGVPYSACVACKANAARSLCGLEGFACVVLQSPAHLSKGC